MFDFLRGQRSEFKDHRSSTKDQRPKTTLLPYSLEEGAVESLAEDDVDDLDGREGARVQLVRAGPAGRKGYGITVDLPYDFLSFYLLCHILSCVIIQF